jgi:hypothetical protein
MISRLREAIRVRAIPPLATGVRSEPCKKPGHEDDLDEEATCTRPTTQRHARTVEPQSSLSLQHTETRRPEMPSFLCQSRNPNAPPVQPAVSSLPGSTTHGFPTRTPAPRSAAQRMTLEGRWIPTKPMATRGGGRRGAYRWVTGTLECCGWLVLWLRNQPDRTS